MKIEKAGYGAGTRDFREHPNVLRLTIGESQATEGAHVSRETITVLEANLDDLSPQVLAYAAERLLAEGALDVFSVPVQMKKGRPGTLLTVLCKPEDAERLTKLIFAETTTLGVRRRDEQRQTLARRWETVEDFLGRCAHQDRQHERQHLELCARVRRLPGSGGSASCTAEDGNRSGNATI